MANLSAHSNISKEQTQYITKLKGEKYIYYEMTHNNYSKIKFKQVPTRTLFTETTFFFQTGPITSYKS